MNYCLRKNCHFIQEWIKWGNMNNTAAWLVSSGVKSEVKETRTLRLKMALTPRGRSFLAGLQTPPTLPARAAAGRVAARSDALRCVRRAVVAGTWNVASVKSGGTRFIAGKQLKPSKWSTCTLTSTKQSNVARAAARAASLSYTRSGARTNKHTFKTTTRARCSPFVMWNVLKLMGVAHTS